MKAQTVALVGINRTSASMGLALKAAPLDLVIIGHDHNGQLANTARETLGALDKSEWNLVAAVAQADIVVLALPADELEATLRVVGTELQSHTLVLDASGPKRLGLSLAGKFLRQGHYVGVQPVLAAGALGEGDAGLAGARGDLFRNSLFCLLPAAEVDPRAVETAVNFGRLLGATPYFIDPDEYDSLVQGIETAPGLLAAAMFAAVRDATGWRDILRFADLPFAQVTAPLAGGGEIARLALDNRDATLRWLDAVLEALQLLRQLVNQKEAERLTGTLTDLAAQRDTWLAQRRENNWVEIEAPTLEERSLSEQMLGSWLAGRRKSDE